MYAQSDIEWRAQGDICGNSTFLPFSFSLYIPVNLWTKFGLTCFYNIRADLECTG